MAQRGWQLTVLEQAPALSEVGAGIQLSPNGLKILRKLGLGPALEARAFYPECLEMRLGNSGRQVFSIPLQAASQKRWGDDYLHLHRADLIEVLAAAVTEHPNIELRCNRQLLSFEQDENGVLCHIDKTAEQAPKQTSELASESLRSELLIGADGIHSRVRSQLFKDVPEQPNFSGNIAWRMTLPMDKLGDLAPPPTACVWVGPGKHAVTYRLRGGELANLVGVVESNSWDSDSWSAKGSREQALADFEGWHPSILHIIEQANSHYRWALCDREPMPDWHSGRAVLLGDACHPMLPFLAQGAAMAIEDAWVLAAVLTQQPVESALASYSKYRLPRCSAVQAAARKNQKTFHHRNPLAQGLHYGAMAIAARLVPQFVHSRQDWLYQEDLTKDFPADLIN